MKSKYKRLIERLNEEIELPNIKDIRNGILEYSLMCVGTLSLMYGVGQFLNRPIEIKLTSADKPFSLEQVSSSFKIGEDMSKYRVSWDEKSCKEFESSGDYFRNDNIISGLNRINIEELCKKKPKYLIATTRGRLKRRNYQFIN